MPVPVETVTGEPFPSEERRIVNGTFCNTTAAGLILDNQAGTDIVIGRSRSNNFRFSGFPSACRRRL